MAKTEVRPRSIPWRSGTWSEAVAIIRQLVLDGLTERDFKTMLRPAITDADLMEERAVQRLNALANIARRIGRNPADTSVDEQAARSDLVAIGVMATCHSLPALVAALDDPVLRERPFTQLQLASVRTIVYEDVEAIFGFDQMTERAADLAIFLLNRADQECRFDDFQVAFGMSQFAIDGHNDPRGTVEVAWRLLEYLVMKPVVNDQEIPHRMGTLRQLHELFAGFASNTSLEIPDPELLCAAGAVEAHSFTLADDFGPHRETVARLLAAFEGTGNTVYLNYLVLYLEEARPDESAQERARRLFDACGVLSKRAFALGRVSDLETAVRLHTEALQLVGRDDPWWAMHCANQVSHMFGLLRAHGLPISPHLDQLRHGLPPLPFRGRGNDDLEGAAEACLARLNVEIAAAVELESAEVRSDCIRQAVLAANEAARLFGGAGHTAKADDLAGMADVLSSFESAQINRELDGDAIETVVRVLNLSKDRKHLTVPMFTVTRWLIAEVPNARTAIIETLRHLYSSEPLGQEASMSVDFDILSMLASAALYRGDICAADDDGRVGLHLLFEELLRSASHSGDLDTVRAASDRPLTICARLTRDAAVEFALAGDSASAARLAQVIAGVRMSNTVLGRMPQQQQDEITSQGVRRSTVIAIAGSRETVVLIRMPGGDWELESRHASARFETFDRFPWLDHGPGQLGLMSLRAWLDGLGTLLNDVLGDAVVRAQDAGAGLILMLPMGTLMGYPLELLTAVRPEIRSPLAIVPGVLADAAADALEEPLPRECRCVFIAGASVVEGSGSIDVESDLHAIRDSGVTTTVVTTNAGAPTDWVAPGSAEILHYAGHLVPDGPDDTAMVLADGMTVSTSEIRAMNLHGVRVAVLMCCSSSASGPASAGDQIQHLAGAFLEADAAAVVANLWPTLDHPTLVFTRRFYEGVASGADIASCFRAAVEAVRAYRVGDMATYAHPMFWSGFTLLAGCASWAGYDSTV